MFSSDEAIDLNPRSSDPIRRYLAKVLLTLLLCSSYLECRVFRSSMSTGTAVRLFTVFAYREELQQKLQHILGISIFMTDGLDLQQ